MLPACAITIEQDGLCQGKLRCQRFIRFPTGLNIHLPLPCGALTVIGVSTLPQGELVVGVKEILGYICLGGAVITFALMYPIPAIKRRKSPGKRNLASSKGEECLIRIEERTGLVIPLQLILIIGSVLLT